MGKLRVIDVLETILALALGEKHFTEMTGPRITEGPLSGLLVFMDLHNEQVATLQELKVSELLDDVTFRTDCIVTVAGSPRTTSNTVGGDLQDLTTADQEGNMKAVHLVGLLKTHGVWVLKEGLKEVLVGRLCRLCGHFALWVVLWPGGVSNLLAMSRMVVHNFVLDAGDELRVTCAAAGGLLPAANDSNNNNNSNNSNQTGGKKNRKNATRKQEGGKKKLSGFMKFSKEQRPNIMKENPGIQFTQVGKKLGEKWRSLSTSEKARY